LPLFNILEVTNIQGRMGRLKKLDKPEELPQPVFIFLLSAKKQRMIQIKI
jgi:hypothetical protein